MGWHMQAVEAPVADHASPDIMTKGLWSSRDYQSNVLACIEGMVRAEWQLGFRELCWAQLRNRRSGEDDGL